MGGEGGRDEKDRERKLETKTEPMSREQMVSHKENRKRGREGGRYERERE